jgi:uncharacterized ferritin-like protein (DUF455 family)
MHKCALVKQIEDYMQTQNFTLLPLDEIDHVAHLIPGRPKNPTLVNPLLVKRRAMHTVEGRAIAIHALTHIEFNAINLALDAAWRFKGMPEAYYLDWLKVACEEAKHFLLLKNYLQELGFDYGSFPAHDSLWEMVDKTKGDLLARMALVPRTMEARGLDAVPQIRARFLQAKDTQMVTILDIILHDEIGHVEIGNRWFNYLCNERQCDPITSFSTLSIEYKAPQLKGPFNWNARKQAGFTDIELRLLEGN